MASVLADLLIKMDVESAKVRAELNKVGQEFGSFGEQVHQIGENVKHIFELEIVEKVAQAAEKMYDFVKSGAEAAEKMGRLAESAGVAVDDFSAMAFAAKMVDTDATSLAGRLEKLARNMAKAGAGSADAVRAFKAIGVEATNTDGTLRDTQTVFLEIADKFHGMENGAGKTALAMMLFGRAGADLIPMLNKGSAGLEEFEDKARAMGKVFTEDIRRGSEQFMESIKQLQGGAQVLGASIASNLGPQLEQLVDSFLEGENGAENMRLASDVLTGVIRGLAGAVLVLEQGLATLGIRFAGIKNVIAAAPQGFAAMRNELYKTYVELQKQDELYNKRMNILGFTDDGGYKPPSQHGFSVDDEDYQADKEGRYLSHEETKTKAPVIPGTEKLDEQQKALKKAIELATEWKQKVATFGMDDLGKLGYEMDEGTLAKVFQAAGPAAEKYKQQILAAARAHADLTAELERTKKGEAAMDDLARYAENLERQLSKVNDATTEEQVRQSLVSGPLRAHIDAMSKAGMDADALVEKILRLAAAIDKKKAEDLEAAEAQRKHDEAMREAKSILESHDGPMEKYRAQVEKINEAYREGGLTAEQHAKALDIAKKNMEKAGGVMNDFAKTYSNEVENIFAQNLFDGFSNGVDGMVLDFGKALEKMVAQAIAADLVHSLFPAAGGGGTDLLNSLGNFITGGSSGGGGDVDMGGGGVLAPASTVEGGGDWTPHFAEGGDIFRSDGPALVGENGPELFTPNVSGHITPTQDLAAALQGGKAQPAPVLQIHPDAMSMTLKDWFEGEMARQAANR